MPSRATLKELVQFAQSFLPNDEAEKRFRDHYKKTGQHLDFSRPVTQEDRDLADEIIKSSVGNIDGKSLANMIDAFVDKGTVAIEDLISILDGAREFFEFMQDLVQSSIEHISQGISVVDQNMRMVAWNRRYLEFFEYPEGYVRVGRPVADLIRFNLEKTGCTPDELEQEVEKRIRFLKEGQPHNFERYRPEGRVLEVSGNPMPGGGFVTSYTDITAHKELENQLRRVNENLEMRVQERTRELEEAIFSKTRFLAATSHDLMQPLNAAGLFTSALQQKIGDPELQSLTHNIASSLQAADDLINSLLEVSRIDSGAIKPKLQSFPIEELLGALSADFTALAKNRGLGFRKIDSSQVVYSDKTLLRRILQNFLSNAIRYTRQGRIVFGCRVRKGVCRIEVWDTGPGIPEDKWGEIFQEFRRLKSHQLESERGLGLGLAISDRLARLLGHSLSIQSWENKGTVFSVEVPLAQSPLEMAESHMPLIKKDFLANKRVLCIDNDKAVLEGMYALLEGWGCDVRVAVDLEQALIVLGDGWKPETIMADYQLDDGATGITVLNELLKLTGEAIPAIIITANNTEDVRELAATQGFHFMAKPVRPASLRALLNGVLAG
ncbi:MAG: PAS-domain containing protein [Pseudomonadales bacterium]|nr:PAS-domain containing protein [Pseudomonadales bacterium]